MDELATNTLSALKRSSLPADQQLAALNTLKSSIKHQRVAESAQPIALECIRFAITSKTSSQLVTAGFSTLSHFIKRLTLQDQIQGIFAPRGNLVPILLEKLGDQKEAQRSAASQCLCDLWSAKSTDIENAIREKAIQSNNARAKEAGMQWVAKMHREQSLPFRNFVPPIVECLDHADGAVRECAKAVVVDLFKEAPNHAKADLKRQLIAFNVRKSIASYILSHLEIPAPAELGSSVASLPASSATSARQPSRPQTPADSGLADAAAGEPNLPPSADLSNIDPLYIHSHRELDDTFRSMQPFFEGKEDEGNWRQRDNSVMKLRRLARGNAPVDMHVPFLAGIKNMLDGILKVVNSLRTTMSTNGCQLVQDLARILGPSIDTMVEILLQSLVKMCAATKHIAAQNGNVTVDVIFSSVSYNARLMQHIWLACQDKNVQPRQFVPGWLKTILKTHAHNRSQFEHSGGLDLTEKCIKKGLADANPKVRENMRSAFWAFSAMWTERANAIMDSLDAKSQQLLQKDPSNPDAPKTVASTVTKPASKPAAARPSLREQIAAQRQAAAKRLPDRPNSAMATLTPAKPGQGSIHATRQPSNLSTSSSASVRPTKPRLAAETSSSTGQGSLKSAPMRRPRNLNIARPATADPYAQRNAGLRAGSPSSSVQSPADSPIRPLSKGSASSTLTNSHMKSNSTTALYANRPGSRGSSVAESPRTSPLKPRPRTIHMGEAPGIGSTSPSVLRGQAPPTSSKTGGRIPQPSHTSPRHQRAGSAQSPPLEPVDEDNLATVLPPKAKQAQMDGKENATSSGRDEDVDVYEDPEAGSGQQADVSPVKSVLEEVPVNTSALQTSPVVLEAPMSPATSVADEERPQSVSPSKKTASIGLTPDRSDFMKNRRLLVSGAERIKAKSLDAHGFRRLQELIKGSSSEVAGPLAELLRVLSSYVQSAGEPGGKASSLRSQALATLRAIVVIHRREETVRREFAPALSALVMAKEHADGLSHVSGDIDRTADEIIKHAHELTEECIDGVLSTVEQKGESKRAVTAGLGVLSKLVGSMQARKKAVSESQRKRLGSIAVKLLDDTDADVRKADTELCLALHGTYQDGSKEEFWRVLKGARETQLNLIAYYIARRSQVGTA